MVLDQKLKILTSKLNAARIIYPIIPGKGVYKPEKKD